MKKILFISAGFILVILLVSCKRSRPVRGGGGTKTAPKTEYITIVNNYDQRQNKTITVNNINNSTHENLQQTINNISNNNYWTTINNVEMNVRVDNSITQNYISQRQASILVNEEKASSGRKSSRRDNKGSSNHISNGDFVVLKHININGVEIGNLYAVVKSDLDQTLVLCEETYNQIQQIIDNQSYTTINPTVKPESIKNDKPNDPFAGTDPGGVNFLTIIGAIVVILFILWIISWFK